MGCAVRTDLGLQSDQDEKIKILKTPAGATDYRSRTTEFLSC